MSGFERVTPLILGFFDVGEEMEKEKKTAKRRRKGFGRIRRFG